MKQFNMDIIIVDRGILLSSRVVKVMYLRY